MRPFLLCALILAGCARGASSPAATSLCREQAFEGSRFTTCDARGGEIRLFAAGPTDRPLRSFAEVAKQIDVSRLAFGMNAGMFGEDGRPIGLAIVAGRQLHKINLRDGRGNFHMKPNGVFVGDAAGRPAIYPGDALPRSNPARLATQSGPMLVIAGKLHPKFEADGESRLIRNGVGVTRAGDALFVISEDPVSFGKFARYFRDALRTPNALYFDGSVSSLWDPANGRQDSHSLLGPIIVVFKPPKITSEESKPGRAGHARP